METVCLNAAGSVKESTALNVRTCFIVNVVLQRVITVKTVKHHSNALIPSVKINVAKIAMYSFVGNVRRDSVQSVHWTVNVVKVQFVKVAITKEGMIVGNAVSQCVLSAFCNANSARIRSVMTALTAEYASRLVRFEKGIYISNPAELHIAFTPLAVGVWSLIMLVCSGWSWMLDHVYGLQLNRQRFQFASLQNLKHVFRQFEYRCKCDSTINRQAAPSNGDELGRPPHCWHKLVEQPNPANNLIH